MATPTPVTGLSPLATPVLVALYLAPHAKAPMQRVPEAMAEAGRGLVGDRYHAGRGAMSRWPGPHREVTLLAEEALAEAAVLLGRPLDGADTRRNLLVRGVDLEVLLKRRFRIGEVLFEGVQRCHPCAYLEKVEGIEGIFRALKGRGGLRARILEGGTLREGDGLLLEAPEYEGRAPRVESAAFRSDEPA